MCVVLPAELVARPCSTVGMFNDFRAACFFAVAWTNLAALLIVQQWLQVQQGVRVMALVVGVHFVLCALWYGGLRTSAWGRARTEAVHMLIGSQVAN